nr:C10 family peptidase [uncultured Draconibacterium sp.]
MKVKFIVVYTILLIFCTNASYSQSHTEELVKIATMKFLNEKNLSRLKSGNDIKLAKQFVSSKNIKTKKLPTIYAYEMTEREGWAFTLNCGQYNQVVAYSFDSNFDFINIPPQIETWITTIINTPFKENLIDKLVSKRQRNVKPIEPFLKTRNGEFIQWDQVAPYNAMCPEIDNEKAFPGCVATAIGQIMRYWEFPYVGTTSIDYSYTLNNTVVNINDDLTSEVYDWSIMPAELNEESTQNEVLEISKLLYHVGLIFNSHYTSTGTGALMNWAINSLGYSFDRKIIIQSDEVYPESKEHIQESLFHNLIMADLEKNIPVPVSGPAPSAHMMVCDGCDDNGYYHLNYGWGGAYNGYYFFDVNPFCSTPNLKLFYTAYIGFHPMTKKYSGSCRASKTVYLPEEKIRLNASVREENGIFASYLIPQIKLLSDDEGIIVPDIDFIIDEDKEEIVINLMSPVKESNYDCICEFRNKLTNTTTPFATEFSFRVDSSQILYNDLFFETVSPVLTTGRLDPALDLEIVVSNDHLMETADCKLSLIRLKDSSVVVEEWTDVKLNNDNTYFDYKFSLSSLPFGIYQIVLELDSENKIVEENEDNNIFTTSFQYFREIPYQEVEALQKLYQGANGANWEYQKGWLTDEPICTWDGIDVSDGHVKQINMLFETNHRVFDTYSNSDLAYNDMDGELPEELGNLEDLEIIQLAYSNLKGNIPVEITNLKKLKVLNLYHNRFEGEIPTNIGDCVSLEELILGENKFVGTIPNSLYSLNHLVNLQLGNNMLSGNISSDVGKLHNLKGLYLSANNFEGTLPIEIYTLKKLTEIAVSHNCLVDLDNVNFFLDQNPFFLDSLQELRVIDVSYNYLSFLDLENCSRIINGLNSKDGCRYQYNPQKEIMDVSVIKKNVGTSVTLKANCDGENNKYRWFKDNEPITEYLNTDSLFISNIQYSDEGIYQCEIINDVFPDLTLKSKFWFVDVGVFTSCDNISTAGVSIYPNPVKNVLTINSSATLKIRLLKIYDSSGKLALELPLNQLESMNLDLSHLKTGFYFLLIETEKDRYSTKLIKL